MKSPITNRARTDKRRARRRSLALWPSTQQEQGAARLLSRIQATRTKPLPEDVGWMNSLTSIHLAMFEALRVSERCALRAMSVRRGSPESAIAWWLMDAVPWLRHAMRATIKGAEVEDRYPATCSSSPVLYLRARADRDAQRRADEDSRSEGALIARHAGVSEQAIQDILEEVITPDHSNKPGVWWAARMRRWESHRLYAPKRAAAAGNVVSIDDARARLRPRRERS
jgi:hypothetical protein